MRAIPLLLTWLLLPPLVRAEEPADPVRSAIDKGLSRIAKGTTNYLEHRDCFSCHHQAMPIQSLASAQRRGWSIDSAVLRRQLEFTLDECRSKKDQLSKGVGLPGGNTQAVYILLALEVADHRADETTNALVQFLLARQKLDGSWPAVTKRPPSEGSAFTDTGLALRLLRSYGPAKDDKGAGELRERIDTALSKGSDWLLTNSAVTTEDKVFRLRGLVSAGTEAKVIDEARDALLREQRDDGSWAQLPDLAGDAYATGTALVALRCAGLDTGDKAYQNGVRYLLRTQNEDGSWIVQTRSVPVQVFFDNGDPGEKSQFISFAATNWAVLALLEQYPVK
jgi:N-acyl-D-amino-acid deacylase